MSKKILFPIINLKDDIFELDEHASAILTSAAKSSIPVILKISTEEVIFALVLKYASLEKEEGREESYICDIPILPFSFTLSEDGSWRTFFLDDEPEIEYCPDCGYEIGYCIC